MFTNHSQTGVDEWEKKAATAHLHCAKKIEVPSWDRGLGSRRLEVSVVSQPTE